MTRVIILGDPSKEVGSLAEPECARILAALDLAEQHARAARVVRAVGGREDLDGERHREHGLDRPGAAAADRVHAGGPRDQHHRHRHQRRRPAVLERRGDDADAHARHPGHDARRRDGADGQDRARLLGVGVGRGQPGHRRVRAHHGPQRPGAVLGARHRRGLPHPAPPLRPHLRGARRALPAAGRHRATRSTRDVCLLPARRGRRARDFATGRRRVLGRARTPGARSRSTSAR